MAIYLKCGRNYTYNFPKFELSTLITKTKESSYLSDYVLGLHSNIYKNEIRNRISFCSAALKILSLEL